MFFQCRLGQMTGFDVHDMEGLGEQYVGYDPGVTRSTQFGLKSLRVGRALEPAFVMTVEPGIYMIPTLMDKWKAEGKFTDFLNYDVIDTFRSFGGIRVEDDIVITETGPRQGHSSTAFVVVRQFPVDLREQPVQPRVHAIRRRNEELGNAITVEIDQRRQWGLVDYTSCPGLKN